MKRFAYLICFFLLLNTAKAQPENPWAGWGIDANYLMGKGFKHSAKMRAGFPYTIDAFELNLVTQTSGTKEWHQRRNYPLLGVGLAYTDYDRNTIYGHAISIYPNIQLPILRLKKFEWTMKLGFGFAYISKEYSRGPDWDTLNTAIGSHINNYTCFATDLRYRFNGHLDIQAGGDFAHISNAAFRQPNLGINKFGAHIGLRYFPVTSRPKRIHSELPVLKNRILAQLRLGVAGNEQSAPNGPMYINRLATAYASYRYAGKNKLQLGVDYAYYKNVERFYLNNEIYPGKEKQHSWRSAVFVGNEFLIGNVSILLQAGYYIKHLTPADYVIYEKLGVNLYLVQQEKGLVKEFFPYIYLKTHGTQAELVEVGLGVGL